MNDESIYGSSENAIISSGELTEHELAMLDLNAAIRIGDDSIEVNDVEETEATDEPVEEDEEEQEETNYSRSAAEEEINAASAEHQEGREGLQSMIEVAVKNGLPQESIDSILNEYTEEETLSEKTLDLLEQHGFNRKFVNTFIKGQQAVVNQLAQSLVNYVGGVEQWEGIISHLESHDKATLDSLQDALDNNNIRTVKTILTLTQKTIKQDAVNKYGTKPERSVAKQSKPTITTGSRGVAGYADQKEMIAAMSDKRYQSDAKYRAEVEQRVMHSNF
ncbi:hypothetical protein LZ634_22470 [Kluyvera intermedia]|uniref:capsid assembly protein n=1 Tax=Kluyvera intermedia TaxID=61648 RepID=UPI001F1EBBF8|nr:hypothetical protein [Kluyvera intermedia]MCE9891433.1 hypothetical protein [Kluyvera intermedia]